MVTKEEYENARKAYDEANATINEYHREQAEAFRHRLKGGPAFSYAELVFAAHNRCPCGAGLAYPKDCGPMHHWDCSAILAGTADPTKQHTAQLPFSMYEIKSELQPSANGATTRGTVASDVSRKDAQK
jgi:hypothetical protein